MTNNKNLFNSNPYTYGNSSSNKIDLHNSLLFQVEYYIEVAADLLAIGVLNGTEYFKVKTLLRSTDPEVKNIGVKFLHEKSKI